MTHKLAFMHKHLFDHIGDLGVHIHGSNGRYCAIEAQVKGHVFGLDLLQAHCGVWCALGAIVGFGPKAIGNQSRKNGQHTHTPSD